MELSAIYMREGLDDCRAVVSVLDGSSSTAGHVHMVATETILLSQQKSSSPWLGGACWRGWRIPKLHILDQWPPYHDIIYHCSLLWNKRMTERSAWYHSGNVSMINDTRRVCVCFNYALRCHGQVNHHARLPRTYYSMCRNMGLSEMDKDIWAIPSSVPVLPCSLESLKQVQELRDDWLVPEMQMGVTKQEIDRPIRHGIPQNAYRNSRNSKTSPR